MVTKRYFWRRFVAFMIDAFVMNIIASIPVMAVSSFVIGLGMGPMASPGSCKSVQGRSDIVQMLDLKPDERAGFLECRSTALLRQNSTIFIVTITKRDGKPHLPRVVTVTDNGSSLQKVDMMPGPASFLPLLAIGFTIPAAFAFFSANGRQTLGKKSMRLRVKRIDDQDPLLPQALAREYWKFLPNLVLGVAMAMIVLIYRDTLMDYVERAVTNVDFAMFFRLIIVIPLIQFSVLLWWLVPFIFWRGQTWHDMLAGTKVVSVEQA